MGGVLRVSRACDRFPSKFQNFERHCRNSSLFLVKCGFTAVALKILKTCMGAYRSLFLIEMSNAARNFSIEDGVYVARSQKSLKVGEKISVEKWKIMVLSKWALFFLVLLCFVCIGPSMNPGMVGKKIKIFTRRGTVRRRDVTAGRRVNI